MQTLTEIRSRLAERGLSPKHRLGQNFLHDHNQLRKLLDAAKVGVGDIVLEIGPGTGALTEPLLDLGAMVIACELDSDLAALLNRHIGGERSDRSARFSLVEGDALRGRHALNPVAIAALADALDEAHSEGGTPATFRLVANLPYGVASPIMAAILVSHGPHAPTGIDDTAPDAEASPSPELLRDRAVWWRPLRESGGGGAGLAEQAGDAWVDEWEGAGPDADPRGAPDALADPEEHDEPSAGGTAGSLASMFDTAPESVASGGGSGDPAAGREGAGADSDSDFGLELDPDAVGVGTLSGGGVELGPPRRRPICTGMYVTVQKEVAERITAGPKDKAYGPLAVLCQALADVRTIAKLSPGCFWPQPKVWSAMVAIEPRQDSPVGDRQAFSNFLQNVFRSRRKQLGSILGRLAGAKDAEGGGLAWPEGVRDTMRPEELDIEQLIALFHAVEAAGLRSMMVADPAAAASGAGGS